MGPSAPGIIQPIASLPADQLAVEAAHQQLGVLFMQSACGSSCWVRTGSHCAVHSALMRTFDPARIACHVAYDDDAVASPPPTVIGCLPPRVPLAVRSTRFGPVRGDDSWFWFLAKTTRFAAPMLRDSARLVRYLRRNDIAIIHATDRPKEAFYGLWLARMSGAKCVVHLHVKYDNWLSPLSRWAIRHADGIIGVSDYVIERAHSHGISPARTFTIQNGIDPSEWQPDATDGVKIRREFGVGADDPLLVMVAALRPWKGQATLIHALPQVVRAYPSVKLLLVGSEDFKPVSTSPSYLAELEQLVDELGLGRNVIFTGHRSDVPNILAAADQFTMPTFEDPCPLAFLEAMAMAKPVVALRSGGVPELVDDGTTGLLSAPDDIDGFAKNVVALLDDPVRAREMGIRARLRVQERFTRERMADGVEDAYRSLLGA